MSDDHVLDPDEGQKESDAIVAKIMKIVGKIPSKVVLVASGDGCDKRISIGSKTTRICGIKSVPGCVTVTFKEPVWGSRSHVAYLYRGKVYFPIASKQGYGLDPEFIIKP